MLAADGVLDRPGDAPGRDGDQPKLIRHAEHHDVDELLASQPAFADFREIGGEAMVGIAALEDLLAKRFRIEIILAQKRINRRLFVHVQHGGGVFRRGDAELLARIDRAGGFEDVDAQQQIGLAVGN